MRTSLNVSAFRCYFSVGLCIAPHPHQQLASAHDDDALDMLDSLRIHAGGADHAFSKLAKIPSCPLLICRWLMPRVMQTLGTLGKVAPYKAIQLCTENASNRDIIRIKMSISFLSRRKDGLAKLNYQSKNMLRSLLNPDKTKIRLLPFH
jgi:hypothetical protein